MTTEPTAPRAVTASLTDVGRQRSANQDRCGEFEDGRFRLLVTADGMGGHRGGEVASQMAVEAIGEVFARGVGDPAATLRAAFELANRRVHERASREPDLQGMGTTAVALLLGPGASAWTAHVGDSRVYRLRGGRIEALTADHSWVAEEVRAGRLGADEALTHPRRNVLTRSVGVERNVRADVDRIELEPDDRLLLCSDGLWGDVPEDRLREALARDAPEAAARALVELANDCGGADNITAQVVQLPATLGPEPSGLAAGWQRPGLRWAAAAFLGLLAAAALWLVLSAP